MKLLIYPPISEHRFQKIHQAAQDATVVQANDEARAVTEIEDADALFGVITPAMLANAQKLRWVQAPTASMEKFLFPELVDSPVVVTNMRGIYGDVIADHVFGFILCFAKNFHRYIRQQIDGVWHMLGRDTGELPGYSGPGEIHPSDRAAITLADCTLGVVGLGGIGAEIARRGTAFHMRVIGVDPKVSDLGGDITVWSNDRLDDLLEQSDFVVIAAPHTPETYKLFRREKFQRMKKTAYLINIGRGVIVDLADLTVALQEGDIAGAGLDVFETEPLPAEHPLWKMENVIITPHCAAASTRVPERHLATLLENVRNFVSGKPLINIVDKKKWF